MLPNTADAGLRVRTGRNPVRGCLFIETVPPPPFLFVFSAARRWRRGAGWRGSGRRAAEKTKDDIGWRLAINRQPRSSPRRVCNSWVRVPPVELGGSRRNGQVPVQPRGWRGLSSPGKEPTGRNEDEPHPMSLVMLNERRRRASGVLREGRCLQETQSPYPANSVGVSVVSTSGRCISDKRGGPGR